MLLNSIEQAVAQCARCQRIAVGADPRGHHLTCLLENDIIFVPVLFGRYALHHHKSVVQFGRYEQPNLFLGHGQAVLQLLPFLIVHLVSLLALDAVALHHRGAVEERCDVALSRGALGPVGLQQFGQQHVESLALVDAQSLDQCTDALAAGRGHVLV